MFLCAGLVAVSRRLHQADSSLTSQHVLHGDLQVSVGYYGRAKARSDMGGEKAQIVHDVSLCALYKTFFKHSPGDRHLCRTRKGLAAINKRLFDFFGQQAA